MSEQQEKLGTFPFVIGGISFIPLVGILFGAVAIIWGLITKKGGGKKLALIGAGGIAFTVLLYSALFYFGFVQRGGVYDNLRSKLAASEVTSLVNTIEFYKTQYGKYPESLKALQQSLPKNSTVMVFDPSNMRLGGKPGYFYYKLVDKEHYYLLGVGPDGQPFTTDDVLPEINAGAKSKVGLLIKEH